MTTFEKAKAALKGVFDAIPKGKFRLVFGDANDLEIGLVQLAQTLSRVRGYFLETTGEESSFVKMIDEHVPRPAAK